MSVENVEKLIKDNQIEFVDLRLSTCVVSSST